VSNGQANAGKSGGGGGTIGASDTSSIASGINGASINLLDNPQLSEEIIFKYAVYVSNQFKFSFLNTSSSLVSASSSASASSSSVKHPFLTRTINVTVTNYLKSLRNSKQRV
jgi:hypothetical protein